MKYCDDCQRLRCAECGNCDCDGYPCAHQRPLGDIPRVSPGCYITIQQALADTEAAYAMIRARLVVDDVDIKESSDVTWVGPKEFRAQFYFPEGLRQGRYGVRYVFLSMDDTWKPLHWTSYNWPPERVRKCSTCLSCLASQ
jgi:hypothetical protein